MENHYYNAEDLGKFGSISEWQKQLGDKFFAWYGEVFKDSALTAKEKSLIALAVAHAVQCPYCIDAYSSDAFEKGWSEEPDDGSRACSSSYKGWCFIGTWRADDE